MPRARRLLIPTAITAVKMLAVTTALADPATASATASATSSAQRATLSCEQTICEQTIL